MEPWNRGCTFLSLHMPGRAQQLMPAIQVQAACPYGIVCSHSQIHRVCHDRQGAKGLEEGAWQAVSCGKLHMTKA